MVDDWVIARESVVIPGDVLARAAETQATLGGKLAALRSLSEPFPETAGPAAGDRWMSRAAADPRTAADPEAVTDPRADADPRAVTDPRTAVTDPRAAADPGEIVAASSAASGLASKVEGDLTGLSAAALLAGYRAGAFDPVEVVDACLARINGAGAAIGAVVALDGTAREQAARSASRWRNGQARPLEGVPVGVKDIISTRGLRTAAGSPLFIDHVPEADATVAARLRDAGAVVLAKTTTPEFAFGDQTGDAVVNPGAPGRWAGGSSSGSAAGLAAGLFPVALGTDTGGSIRVPSSYCGVSGIKATFGRVPRDGVFSVSWTLDNVGPMARTVEDLGRVLDVIAGRSEADPYSATSPVAGCGAISASLRGLRVGVPCGWLPEGSSPGVAAALSGALGRLEDLGCTVEPVPFPHAELAGIIAWVITVVEFAAHHTSNLHRIGEFTPSAACRLAAGARTSAADYLKALRARSLVQGDLAALFEQVDVLVTAATPTSAPDPATFFDDGDRLWLDQVARNFLPFNVSGHPALVVPVGVDEDRPAAVQIVAPHHRDALCLQVGAALQTAAPSQSD